MRFTLAVMPCGRGQPIFGVAGGGRVRCTVAFFKIPASWDPDGSSWQALLSRWCMSGQEWRQHSIRYVDGCPVVRNPATPATGLTTLNQPWLLGGYEYAGAINRVFSGWLGDVRIVNRPLSTDQFMIA